MPKDERYLLGTVTAEIYETILAALAASCAYDPEQDALVCNYDPKHNPMDRARRTLLGQRVASEDIIEVQQAAYDGLLANYQQIHHLTPGDFNV